MFFPKREVPGIKKHESERERERDREREQSFNMELQSFGTANWALELLGSAWNCVHKEKITQNTDQKSSKDL